MLQVPIITNSSGKKRNKSLGKKGSIVWETPSRIIQTPEALLNKDILHAIFEHFDLQPGSDTVAQARKDLLSAAKTCKAFVEPALNSLWRVLPSFLPLLLLLPSAEVHNNHLVSPRPFSCLSCCLTRVKFVDRLSSSNWERFDIHAPRVRTLYIGRCNIVVSPHVYLRIRSMRPRDTPLLPGLKEIHIPDNTSLDLSSALLLASDSSLSLVQLHNSATSDRQFCIPFLFLLSINSPKLGHLALCETMDTPLDLSLVPRFRNLQSLELRLSGTYLSSQFLQDLGKLDDLLDMTLDTGPTQVSTTRPLTKQPRLTLPSVTNHSTFIKLRKLHILGTPSSISRVLNEMNGLTNLTTLIIHAHDAGTEDSWQRCFVIISAFLAIENMEITQSIPVPYWHSGHHGYALSTSCFYPLYKLDNMTSFVINDSTLSGSDDDFRFLACAFPRLKKFVEPCAIYAEGRTLACLGHFSQANADLREIRISLSSDISKNLNAIDVPGRPIIQNHQHPLEKLYIASHFGSLDLADMIKVAQFLDLIFPNLSTLESYHPDMTETSNWAKIQQIRLALQAARINASSASKI